MNFELWIFTIKQLATIMDAAKLIYDGLSDEEKEDLHREYDAYINGEEKPASKKKAGASAKNRIVQTAGRDQLGDFAPDFAHYNDDILFGENWNNTDIDPKTRSIITVVALMAQGITDQSIRHHVENAKNNGVSREEMAAVITHTAFYAGWPKAWAAFRIAKAVYGDPKDSKK